MCGRAVLTSSPEDLRQLLGLDERPELTPSYNIPPSRPLAVVRSVEPGPGKARVRRLEMLRWGLLPAWASEGQRGQPPTESGMALARVETVATTRAFRDAVRRRRCLVVVDGFYEWKRAGKAPSQPYFMTRAQGGPLTLAGLWERRVSRAGEVIESCAIVTQEAQGPARDVHNRQPLVLEPAEWGRWLDPSVEAVDDLLVAHSPELVVVCVSPRVNDPRNDDAACIAPWAPAQQSLF